jgi:hypothetical protein
MLRKIILLIGKMKRMARIEILPQRIREHRGSIQKNAASPFLCGEKIPKF